jgi:hypothetical protein
MIITIINTNLPLILEPETKLRFKLNSPVFSAEGSSSMPFTVKAEKNCVALGHPERFHRSDVPELVFDVLIESAVLPWDRGRLFVEVSDSTYSCSLSCGEGEFYNRIQNTKLADLVDLPVVMGDDADEFIAAANDMITKNYPEVNFQFPLMQCSSPYDNEVMAQFFKFINYYKWHEASPSFAKNEVKYPGLYNDAVKHYNLTSYVPCPFVFAVLKNMASMSGFRCPDTPPFTDTQINQLLFVNNQSLDKKKTFAFDEVVKVGRATDLVFSQTSFQSLGNPLLFDDNSSTPFQDVYSRYRLEGVPYEQGYFFMPSGDRIWQFHYKLIVYNHEEANRTIILHPKLYNSGDGFSNGYDEHTIAPGETMTIEGSFVWGEDGGGVALRATFVPEGDDYGLTLKAGSVLDIIPISDNLFVDIEPSFNLANNLPSINAAELLSDLKWLFGMVAFTDRDSVNFRFIRDILASVPSADLSAYLLRDYQKNSFTKIRSLGFPDGFDSSDFAYTSPTPNVLDYSTEPKQIIYMRAEGQFYINNHDEFYNFSWSRWRNDVNRRQVLPASESGDDVEIVASIPELIMANHDYTESGHWLPVISLQNKLLSPFNDPAPEVSERSRGAEILSDASGFETPYLLAFWRGLQNDSDADPYPFASPFAYKLGGSAVSGINTQLRFNGEYGLYAKYLQAFITLLNTPNNIYTVEMNLPSSLLKRLRFDETYLTNEIQTIIKSIDLEVNVDDTIVQPVTLEVVRL